ncbi:Helix-turn-helix domain protein [Labrenzia sp. THAF35]|uniref:helix-turn-helix domain-containing protein n=1 Tax=Labrenzia sp. THAF35 TaxID=2587854 RepID=UPI0012693F11|nr:helix-turn-helix transcriptional regulator [Labrenzia sp. THAF35]QFT68643.1 Helix-turn-helix domain protein [Labrenzia sp. THAF35]
MSKSLYSDNNQRLCAILRRERVRKELHQKDLAELISRNQSFVTRYESGQKTLDVHEFLSICQALDYDPHLVIDELLSWSAGQYGDKSPRAMSD